MCGKCEGVDGILKSQFVAIRPCNHAVYPFWIRLDFRQLIDIIFIAPSTVLGGLWSHKVWNQNEPATLLQNECLLLKLLHKVSANASLEFKKKPSHRQNCSSYQPCSQSVFWERNASKCHGYQNDPL
ncbi:hypothetical protein CEXT_556321 [Caerostris extrusa]|uniref:Uncharacterized protein n=1 Tax=Caerostris extrusa TaxID=172846 RepID=A0AAV4X077_CAEEX|nr:hypothetical protein CEXT_556321 [Caerostris extrusa]